MCGICGKFNFKHPETVSESTITAMADQMISRGPDDSGIYVKKNVGLGFRRLSIIDVEGGNQPISNETGEIWVVANGEVYNYLELTSQLRSKGHHFKTKTDVEVIVHAYEEYGLDCFSLFQGMFGIAIWDARHSRLVMARDGIGIKPLYYAENEKGLVFGSEIKAFFKDEDTDFNIDLSGLAYFFAFNYIPDPYSIFKNIKKLLPGHYLICENSDINIFRYWNIAIDENPDAISEGLFREELEAAVKSQLVSDVPVGAFLSGGIDSSGICAYYSKDYKGILHTFSAGFREESYNELYYARIVAKKLGTNHHEIIIEDKIEDSLFDIITYFDEPFADSSMVPLFFLSKLAKEYVKVVLVGDGADELFGGYDTYLADSYLRTYRHLPKPLRIIMEHMINRLPVSHAKVSIEHKLKRFVKYGGEDDIIFAHALWRSIFDKLSLGSLLHPDIFREIKDLDVSEQYKATAKEYHFKQSINDFCYLDFRNYLQADMLVKVDRMTMMNSLEARPPFLDQHFVKYAFSVPSKYKIRLGQNKYIMKKALRNLLPAEIINRKKKGFNVPLAKWMDGPLKALLSDFIESSSDAHAIVNKQSVIKLLDDHNAQKADNSFQLWNILVFYIWFEHLFKKLRSGQVKA